MESNVIERVTNPADGPMDGVSLMANGVHTKFGGKGSRRRIVKQSCTSVSIKASVETGIVSISDRCRDTMISVSLQDMAALLAEAFNAAKEVDGRCQAETSEPAGDVGDK